MESYEKFKARNANWNYWGFTTEKDLDRNYKIALEVERVYNEKHNKVDEPQIGDIVEFADQFRVYERGKIVENMYRNSDDPGMLCICESGSSFTNGSWFETSGGAFNTIHKSKLQFVGEDENIVRTWGCNGAGGNQGIYFPLKVRKWIIPYDEKALVRSVVRINGEDAKTFDGFPRPAVEIENTGDWCVVHSFNSFEAFKAWAKYIGYEYEKSENDSWEYVSNLRVENRCVLDLKDLPSDVKTIKVLANGKVRDGWVRNDGKAVTEIWLNKYDPEEYKHPYGSKEWKEQSDKEFALYRKYSQNPMGV